MKRWKKLTSRASLPRKTCSTNLKGWERTRAGRIRWGIKYRAEHHVARIYSTGDTSECWRGFRPSSSGWNSRAGGLRWRPSSKTGQRKRIYSPSCETWELIIFCSFSTKLVLNQYAPKQPIRWITLFLIKRFDKKKKKCYWHLNVKLRQLFRKGQKLKWTPLGYILNKY